MNRKNVTISVVFLCLLISNLNFVARCEDLAAPNNLIMGDFDAPTTVYANNYFYLDCTISSPNGAKDFVAATLEISNAVFLKWENSTNTFAKLSDVNNYCTLDAAHSIKKTLNSTSYRLSWRLKLDWTYPEGNVDILASNTKIVDSKGKIASGDAKRLFIFEPDLVVAFAKSNSTTMKIGEGIAFDGIVNYEGTDTPPAHGSAAAEFDGISSFVEIPESSNLNLQVFTIEAWVKLNSYSAWLSPIFDRASENGGYSFWIGGEGHASKKLILNGGLDIGAYSSLEVELNEWTYVAAVWNGKNTTFYKNGFAETCYGYSYAGVGSITAEVGSERWAFRHQFFHGAIDEVRIYNRPLTAQESHEHYYGIYKNETGLALHLNFDGDCRDSSGLENHGTNNGVYWTDGMANVNVKVELAGNIKQFVVGINSTCGSFVIPELMSEFKTGPYTYNLYATTSHGNSVQNKTVNVTVYMEQWYELVVKWLFGLHPLIWVLVPALISLSVLLSLQILKIEIKKTKNGTAHYVCQSPSEDYETKTS